MREGASANQGAVLVAVFSWATGLLSGVLIVVLYFRSLAPAPPSPTPPNFVSALPQSPLPRPAPTPTPDCPAYAIWSSCDPVAHSMVALEKGLASGKVGFVEISSARPWPVSWQVKVDGISNLSIGSRNMIVPGLHKIELFDFSQMRRLECHVRITQNRLSRVAFSDDGKCQIEEGDPSPGPSAP